MIRSAVVGQFSTCTSTRLQGSSPHSLCSCSVRSVTWPEALALYLLKQCGPIAFHRFCKELSPLVLDLAPLTPVFQYHRRRRIGAFADRKQPDPNPLRHRASDDSYRWHYLAA